MRRLLQSLRRYLVKRRIEKAKADRQAAWEACEVARQRRDSRAVHAARKVLNAAVNAELAACLAVSPLPSARQRFAPGVRSR